MPKNLSLAFMLLFTSTPWAQNWTTFTNMNTINEIIPIGESLYCATNGGVLVVNSSNRNFRKITNTDGLGGISIESGAWDGQNYLWLGSSNGKLSRYDIHNRTWKVYNQFVDQSGQKLDLLSLCPDGDKIWVGHSQGVSLFDRDRNGGEIKETYQNFDGLSAPMTAQSCLVWNNQIWIGTNGGVAFADKNDFNLLDPSHWTGIDRNSGKGLSNDFVLSLEVWQDSLWVGTKSGVFRFNPQDTSFSNSGPSGLEFRDLQDLNGQLYAATQSGLYLYSSGSWILISSDSLLSVNLNSAAIDDSGRIWIGTQGKGLSEFNGIYWENLNIPGPPANVFNDLAVGQSGRVWCTNENLGAAVLDNQSWTVFDTFNTLFISVAVDLENQTWFGTNGRGVLRLRNGIWLQYNHLNSPLRPVCTNPNSVAVYGISIDELGNRWFGNRDACDGTALVGLLAGTDATFISYKVGEKLNGASLRSNSVTEKGCLAKGGTIWLGYRDVGLDALNYQFTLTNRNDDFVTNFEASNFAFGLISSLAVDKAGIVWIGTSGGPYRYDPSTFQLSGINLPANLGPQVNSIAVDGRNNKWLGTIDGLAILDSDGNLIDSFSTDNSPLADNFIYKVSYDEKRGDLWIGTANGLSRFTQPLTQPAADLDQVYAYPNPFVISMGTEKVSFAKLPFEARVNIFSLAGDFIRELRGTNQWDGRNDEGKLVASGVYLFSAASPGSKTSVGKIALIRK